MAIASWHQSDAQALEVNVQTQPHKAPAGTSAEAAYLPSLFVEEERAARIEPLPPQF